MRSMVEGVRRTVTRANPLHRSAVPLPLRGRIGASTASTSSGLPRRTRTR
jgi:hypothetical protein